MCLETFVTTYPALRNFELYPFVTEILSSLINEKYRIIVQSLCLQIMLEKFTKLCIPRVNGNFSGNHKNYFCCRKHDKYFYLQNKATLCFKIYSAHLDNQYVYLNEVTDTSI